MPPEALVVTVNAATAAARLSRGRGQGEAFAHRALGRRPEVVDSVVLQRVRLLAAHHVAVAIPVVHSCKSVNKKKL